MGRSAAGRSAVIDVDCPTETGGILAPRKTARARRVPGGRPGAKVEEEFEVDHRQQRVRVSVRMCECIGGEL